MRYLTEKEKSWSDEKLERKVFIFDGAEAHKRFFKNKIIDFLQGEQRQTFSQYMWEAIWECNDCGKYSMYLYFNEYIQKLYIDKYFYEWMTRMIEKIDVELEKVSLLNSNEPGAVSSHEAEKVVCEHEEYYCLPNGKYECTKCGFTF